MWLRENGLPYYIGKGCRRRAFVWQPGHWPPNDLSRIIIFSRKTEQEAFETEIELIRNWGRQDLGTGVLKNRTFGGENPPNHKGTKKSEETRRRMKENHVGNRGYHHTEETKVKISAASKRFLTGRKLSPEHCASIGKSKKGKHYNLGYRHTEEARKRMSVSKRGLLWGVDRYMIRMLQTLDSKSRKR